MAVSKTEQQNGKSPRPPSYGTKSPIELPATFEDFFLPNYAEGSRWHDLDVPGNWEMAGYSPATYYRPDNASGFYLANSLSFTESWKVAIIKMNF